ncbi:MAG: N-acetylmuramoyl-L-alanine amidase, partial [Verrucomicrobiota bacterium]
RYANHLGVDLMISLHTNGSQGTGTETYHDSTSGNPAGSLAAANAIHANVISSIRGDYDPAWTDRGVKNSLGAFGEIREANVPAVLIEVAFHDTFSDNTALQDTSFRTLVANAIANGVDEYFNGAAAPNAFMEFPNIADDNGNSEDDVAVDWWYSGQPDPADYVYRLQISRVNSGWSSADGFTTSAGTVGSVVVNHIIQQSNPWGSGSSFIWDAAQVGSLQNWSGGQWWNSVSEAPLPGTTYHYTMYAYDQSSGNRSAFSPVRSFVTSGGGGSPVLSYESHLIDDDTLGGSNGDDDGVADPGEAIEVPMTLNNSGAGDANNVSATLSTSDPYITITDDNVTWGTIAAGAMRASIDFDFDVAANCPPGRVITFNLNIVADEGSWSDTFTITIGGAGVV